MIASTSSRTLSQVARPVARRALPRNARVPSRGYATEAKKPDSSHLVSGLMGGGLVLGGLYGYYKYTGADKVVSSARSISSSAEAAKAKLQDVAPGSTKEALALAKSVAKTYASAIPGGAYAIDRGFKEIEEFLDTHGEAATKLVKETYAEVEEAAKGGKDQGEAIVNALKKAGEKVQKLVGEQAQEGWEKLGEKYPQLKEQLGEQGAEFKELVSKHGPEASTILTSFYTSGAAIVSKGGFNAKTYESLKDLLAEKKDELTSFSQKAGKDAWEKASKAAGPALEKMPDVKKQIEENLGKVEGYVGEDRLKVVKELYSSLSKIAEGEGSVEDKTKKAKDLVEKQLGESSQFVKLGLGKVDDLASQGKKWLESATGLTGLSKVFEEIDLASLKKVATSKGDEGKKLLDETYSEIREILEKKSKKAKELAEDTKEDAKGAAKGEKK